MGYFKRYKVQVILGPLFKLFEALLELLNPILMARIIDIGIKNGDKVYILRVSGIILICNLLGFICAVISQKCASVASCGIAQHMRSDMYDKINEFSHEEIDKFGTSSLLNRVTNDVSRMERLISKLIRVIARTPCLLVGSLILSIFINKRLSLIFCVVLPIIILVLVWFTKASLPYYRILREKLDTVSKITRENLNGIRVIRAFNHQEEEKKRFGKANKDLADDSIKVARIMSFLNPFIYLIVDFSIIAALYFGGIQVNIGGLTQGELIAFCNYFSTISAALIQISTIYVSVVNSSASWHRIKEVLTTQNTVIFTNTNNFDIKHYKSKPIMEFKNVGFSFDPSEQDEDRLFIKNLSFKIMPNDTIGIIGPTGAGKTTLVNLICRFYDCNLGSIELYGRNIKLYSKEQLRQMISITQQRSDLFSGSLRENMQLRKHNATDREIIKALKTAQAWEFVKDWPNGLNYQIMAGGKNVSGGQKQRLTIARSLIGKPDLLVLDDSASALDFLTDYNLRKALKKDMKCATVIVSQRATTIKNADLIIVMEHGEIIGMGKHSDLMKKCPLYKETYVSQTKREE